MSPDRKTAVALQLNKLERILVTATDGIVALDKQGKYVYANAAAEIFLGISRDEILQRAYNQASWKLTTLNGQPLPDEEAPFKRCYRKTRGGMA